MTNQSITRKLQHTAQARSQVFTMCKTRSKHFLAIVFLPVVLAGTTTRAQIAPTPPLTPNPPLNPGLPQTPGSPLSSDFPGPFWQIQTPVGGSVTSSNTHLFLTVPAGGSHDSLASPNQAVRAMQPIGDVNFDVSIKIDSPVNAADVGTRQGLMVVSDAKNWLTFELAPDGSNIHLSAETVTNGTVAKVLDDADFDGYQTPMYLRLARKGNQFAAYSSVDGSTWTQAAAIPIPKGLTYVGPFASNSSATPSQAVAVSMSINWFKVQP